MGRDAGLGVGVASLMMGGTMLAAIDIHKAVFQTAVLNPDDGEVLAEERFKASREELVAWIEKWEEKLDAVAIEATTGWRWVTRELQARGIDVRLTDPGQASALQGQPQAAQDRPSRRAMARDAARARGAPRSVGAPARHPVPARPDPAAQVSDRRPHPMRQGDLAREDRVRGGHVGGRLAVAVLELDLHASAELLEAEACGAPVDANGLADLAGLLGGELPC